MEDKEVIFILSGIIDKLVACINPEAMATYETKKVEASMSLMQRVKAFQTLREEEMKNVR